jgi:hypothetical protein
VGDKAASGWQLVEAAEIGEPPGVSPRVALKTNRDPQAYARRLAGNCFG